MNSPEALHQSEILIIGKGVSGLILSLLLQRAGVGHRLLSRVEKRLPFGWGETLPPSTLPLLKSLGLLDVFEQCATKTRGYHSLWGSHQVRDTNFFSQPRFQYGLKLDKKRLLELLQEQVQEQVLEFDEIQQLAVQNGEVQVQIRSGETVTNLQSPLVVDATGRARAVLKRLAIPSKDYDRLLAFSVHLPKVKHARLVHGVFVEPFEHGWGIVSALNETTQVMTLFTEQEISQFSQFKQYALWKELLSGTQILKDFLVEGATPHVVGAQANSSKATRLAGKNWLAIGDAALAFDPLSSHGISNAVYGAHSAYQAIIASKTQRSSLPLQGYEKTLSGIFEGYLQQRRQIYAQEKRWPNQPFWKHS